MAKKNKRVHSDGINKSVEEMSDLEFITYADYLSSPYYRAYMAEKSRIETAPSALTLSVNRQSEAKYIKKRTFFLAVIALLMLATIIFAAIGAAGFNSADVYVSLYEFDGDKTDFISILDPAFGIMKELGVKDLESVYYDRFFLPGSENASDITKTALYAVPIASLIAALFVLIGFLKALVAVFSGKRKDGGYRKFGFGFIGFVLILCALTLMFGGIYASAGSEIGGFFTGENAVLQASPGFYLIAACGLISLLCSIFAYKKNKNYKEKK